MEYILIFIGIIIIVFAVLYYKDLKWKNKVQLEYAERKKSSKKNKDDLYESSGDIFKNHSKEFLKKMESVSDFYNIIIARGNWHKMEVERGIKAEDYRHFANGHLEEYILKYDSNIEKDFYPTGLNFRKEKFFFITNEFEKLFGIAAKLKVNIPTPMYYDYCAARSSLLGVELAIEEIKKSHKKNTIISNSKTDNKEYVDPFKLMKSKTPMEEWVTSDFEEFFDIIKEINLDLAIFPGCEKVSKIQRKKCFQEKMNKHIVKNFKYPETAQEMGIQGRVLVRFIIDEEGNVTKILTEGIEKVLKDEAKRIISLLPKMVSAKRSGKAIKFPYSIPITFKLID